MSLAKFCNLALDVSHIPHLLKSLPFNQLDNDSWDAFIEAQRSNRYVDNVFLENVDDTGGSTDFTALFRRLADIMEYHLSIEDNDAFFWDVLCGLATDNVEMSSTTSVTEKDWKFHSLLSPEQGLLLILLQNIYGQDIEKFLSASRLYLILLHCPTASDHYFSLNLFILRQVLTPLRYSLCGDRGIFQQDSPTLQSSGSSDNGHTLHLPSAAITQLLIILGQFLNKINLSFLHAPCSMEVIFLILESMVTAMLDTRVDEENREKLHDTLLDFLLHIKKLRQTVIERVSQRDTSEIDCTERICDALRHEALFVPVDEHNVSVDILTYVASCCFRFLCFSLACRPTSSQFICQYTSLPKRLLVGRQTAMIFLKDAMRRVPVLLNPAELYIDLSGTQENDHQKKKKKRKAHDKIRHDDVIKSDDETQVQEDEEDEKNSELAEVDDIADGGSNDRPHESQDSCTPEKKMVTRTRFKKEKIPALLASSCRDPFCVCLSRTCLLAVDRRECRELIAAGMVYIFSVDEAVLLDDKKGTERRRKVSEDKDCDTSLTQLVEGLFERFSGFLLNLLRGGKLSSFRTVALDVARALAEYMYKRIVDDAHKTKALKTSPTEGDCETEKCLRLFQRLVLGIVERVGDIQPTTRTRAVEGLASLVSMFSSYSSFFSEIIRTREIGQWSMSSCPIDGQKLRVYCLVLSKAFGFQFIDYQGPFIDFASIIYDRIYDARQVIRKSTLNLIRNLGLLLIEGARVSGISNDELENILERHGILDPVIMEALCTDTSLQAVIELLMSITDAYTYGMNVFVGAAPLPFIRLQRLSLTFILRAIRDPEKNVVDKAMGLIEGSIINGMARTPKKVFMTRESFETLFTAKTNDAEEHLTLLSWRIFKLMTAEDLDYIGRYFAVSLARENEAFPVEFFQRLELIIKNGISFYICRNTVSPTSGDFSFPLFSSAHILRDVLQLVLSNKKTNKCLKISTSLLMESVNDVGKFFLNQSSTLFCPEEAVSEGTYKTFQLTFASQFLLEAVNHLISYQHSGSIHAGACLSVWETVLAELKAPLPIIAPALKCILSLKKQTESGNNQEWVDHLASKIEGILFDSLKVLSSIRTPLDNHYDERTVHKTRVLRCFVMLGDIVLLGGYRPQTSLMKTAQAIVDRSLPPREVVVHNVDIKSDEDTIRAQALVFLGKLCLVDTKYAKTLIDFLVPYLSPKESDVVLCNSLSVFADFCVRYAFLTDNYLSHFTVHLASGGNTNTSYKPGLPVKHKIASPLIRKQCFCLLAGLVAQDFVKCKGLLVFRILSCLGDPHPTIRSLAESVVKYNLIPRQANFIQNHVVEMICFMCSWPDHPLIKSALPNASFVLRKGCPFCYISHPQKRQAVYCFFLQHMTDKDRHELSRRLIHNFLGAFVDTVEDDASSRVRRQLDLPKSVDEPAGSALRDALRLLGCKQMKITFHRHRLLTAKNAQGDVELQDDMPPETAGLSGENNSAETGTKDEYEASLLKRNLAYQILPTLLSLKRVMEDARSPFLGDILQCFKALLFDYRNELSDILFHDPILAKQLDFDFKRDKENHSHDVLDLTPSHTQVSRPEEIHTTGGRRSLFLDATGYYTTAFGTTSASMAYSRSGYDAIHKNKTFSSHTLHSSVRHGLSEECISHWPKENSNGLVHKSSMIPTQSERTKSSAQEDRQLDPVICYVGNKNSMTPLVKLDVCDNQYPLTYERRVIPQRETFKGNVDGYRIDGETVDEPRSVVLEYTESPTKVTTHNANLSAEAVDHGEHHRIENEEERDTQLALDRGVTEVEEQELADMTTALVIDAKTRRRKKKKTLY